MTKHATKPQTPENDAQELDELQLEEIAGGFNPQPEPPAENAYPTFDPTMDTLYRRLRRF